MSKAPADKPAATPADTPADKPVVTSRPPHVVAAVAAMALAAVAALIASIEYAVHRSWLTNEQIKANVKAGKTESTHDLHNTISQQQRGAIIGTVVVMVAIALIASGAWRGRHWARWGVVAFWFLATYTGTFVGALVFALPSSAPIGFRLPVYIAGASMIIAVVLVNFRASTSYFALSKPVGREGAPARRGLFAPRTPPQRGRTAAQPEPARAKSALTSSAASRGETYVQKSRSKKRATSNAEAVARGAELARSRAKASKSRRGSDG